MSKPCACWLEGGGGLWTAWACFASERSGGFSFWLWDQFLGGSKFERTLLASTTPSRIIKSFGSEFWNQGVVQNLTHRQMPNPKHEVTEPPELVRPVFLLWHYCFWVWHQENFQGKTQLPAGSSFVWGCCRLLSYIFSLSVISLEKVLCSDLLVPSFPAFECSCVFNFLNLFLTSVEFGERGGNMWSQPAWAQSVPLVFSTVLISGWVVTTGPVTSNRTWLESCPHLCHMACKHV